jgi:hypothetical protein
MELYTYRDKRRASELDRIVLTETEGRARVLNRTVLTETKRAEVRREEEPQLKMERS